MRILVFDDEPTLRPPRWDLGPWSGPDVLATIALGANQVFETRPRLASKMINAERATTRRLGGWAVALLLVLHGSIHLLGPLEIWGIVDLDELSGQPTIDFGQATTDLLAGGWIIALILFIGAGTGLLVGHPGWRTWALSGVVVSQAVIVIWWEDAATGTIPNLLVMAALLSSRGWDPTKTIRSVEARAE